MKRSIIAIVLVAAVIGGGVYYFKRGSAQAETGAPGGGGLQGGGFPGGGGFGGGFGGGGFGGGGFGQRLPMTIEVATVHRSDLALQITIVGNLIGAATVEAVPKVAGRLETVLVRLGDRVNRGQLIAKVEDREIQEQVKQAQASYEVSQATIRQREADLKLANTNLERSRNLFERQLIPKQTYDDTDARYQAALAQLDLARAQFAQAQARLDELKINLSNTVITSPVSGFIGKRALDPGAWVTPNSSFISVVDIGVVRLVANVVEKDIRRITQGLRADVEVDAYPGEHFVGHVAHIAPVLDPATRTAQIEIEIENPQFRLKPGMYAKVSFTVDQRQNALAVPLVSLVDVAGNRGVFTTHDEERGQIATFKKIDVGIMTDTLVEVLAGLNEGDTIVTTGAAALREGDRVLLPGQSNQGVQGGPGQGEGRQGFGQGGEGQGGRQGFGEGQGQGQSAPGQRGQGRRGGFPGQGGQGGQGRQGARGAQS
jgi:HlyD family secretion protein